jgi:AmmeMemoRadiSam system protein B
MLVFSALVPNSPLLLPSINKEASAKIQKTSDAFDALADELYASHPETIVLIGEHPTIYKNSFSINVADPYEFDLSAFGNLGFEMKLQPNMRLIDKLQRSLRSKELPCTLTTDQSLNYASAVPLQRLAHNLPKLQLVPICYSKLPAKEHFQFGQAIKDEIMNSDKRIAVIATGDMSHALSSDAPAGFTQEGEQFDKTVQELLTQKNTSGLISLDADLVELAHERSYRPLLVLMGLLDRISYTPDVLSYEAPMGVGYLTVEFKLT